MQDSTPKICLIAAMDVNNTIGINNTLPWDIPEDLQYFREKTRGKPIIMGRKTYESIGRLLPKRPNVIITRNPNYQIEGALMVASLEEGIELATTLANELFVEEIMVIGGAQIYAQALPFAHRLYLTEIDAEVEGDAHFPNVDKTKWVEVANDYHDSTFDTPAYAFKTYELIEL